MPVMCCDRRVKENFLFVLQKNFLFSLLLLFHTVYILEGVHLAYKLQQQIIFHSSVFPNICNRGTDEQKGFIDVTVNDLLFFLEILAEVFCDVGYTI